MLIKLVNILNNTFDVSSFETNFQYNNECFTVRILKQFEYCLDTGKKHDIWLYILGIEYISQNLVSNAKDELPKNWEFSEDYLLTDVKKIESINNLDNQLKNVCDDLINVLERKRIK